MLSLSHEVFIEVASHLSFSKAAKTLYISQPAISRHIKTLEERYNFALFERYGNNIRLTAVGEKLFSYLSEAKQIQRKIEFDISSLNAQRAAKGNLKLGASTTVSLYIIPQLLSQFLKTFANVHAQVVNRNTENIITALANKQIDLGIVEVERKLNTFQYEYFTSDKVIPVCSPFNPIAKQDTLFLKELIKQPIALRENGSGTLSAIARELHKSNIAVSQLNTKVKLGGTEALKNYILADFSIGFLPQKSVIKELAKGELVELHIPDFEIKRDFFFVKRKGEQFDLIKRFISSCKTNS